MKDTLYIQALFVHLDLADLFYATKYENFDPEGTLDGNSIGMDDEEECEGEE